MSTPTSIGRHSATEATSSPEGLRPRHAALVLRVGLGLVILFGGWSKLLQLLDAGRQQAFVERYMSADGYINTFFAAYLFEGAFGSVLTPWLFLTTLSALELLCGVLLIVGLLVRPQALVWGLLFWSFVAALPVVTASGAEVDGVTHTTPALLVMIRDIGLSGMFFVLFNLGAGAYSLDERLFGAAATRSTIAWDNLGLLLRMSVGLPLLVGGAFAGFAHIQSYGVPPVLLLGLGLLLLLNVGVRFAGAAVVAIMLWHFLRVLDPGSALIATLNSFKREFAFVAAGFLLFRGAGGDRFSIVRVAHGWRSILRPGEPPTRAEVASR